VGKPQRRIACDPSLAIYDLSNPIGGDTKLSRQFSRRHANGFQPLRENFTRLMDCRSHIDLEEIGYRPFTLNDSFVSVRDALTMYVNRTLLLFTWAARASRHRQSMSRTQARMVRGP
jgi:hypothetical protein